jgi:hypothetical protein
MTGNDVINEALLLDGIIYAGQIISPEAAATSLFGLNNMLGEWNAQGKAVFSILRATYPLVQGLADYTLGPGGSMAGTRPEKIEAWAAHSPSSGSDGGKPIEAAAFSAQRATLERAAWELGLLNATSLEGLRIKILNYDAAYPVATVHVYPAPSNCMTLDLWTWEQLVVIADPTLALDFPPGYLKAIVYNLAVDLAPKFGREVGQTVAAIATECKQGLAGTNTSEFTRRDPGTVPPAAPQQQQQ